MKTPMRMIQQSLRELTINQLKVYYDGACPICSREMHWLKARAKPELISFVDFSSSDFVNSDSPLTRDDLMREIHAVDSQGQILRGMEVFRAVYCLIGLGWLMAPTGWRGFRGLFDFLYSWFARNRLRMTGRRSGSKCCSTHPSV
jgi:predicted DCC family thiol-disulfide oxidoreductase YuxK